MSGRASFRSAHVKAAIPTSPRTRAIRISSRAGRTGIRNGSMKMKKNAPLAAIAHPLPERRALQIVQSPNLSPDFQISSCSILYRRHRLQFVRFRYFSALRLRRPTRGTIEANLPSKVAK